MDSEADLAEIEKLQEQLDRWNFVSQEAAQKTQDDVEAVEAELGRRLPEDYRWFCLEYGRGALRQPVAIRLFAGADDSEPLGRDRVRLARLGYFTTLLDALDSYGSHDADLGPCATTIFGDVFFLRFDDENDGSVWFWDNYYVRDFWNEQLRVADSFTSLLASSEPSPQDLD